MNYYDKAINLLGEIWNNFSNEDKEWFRTTDAALMHRDLGMHLRNHCGMWETPWEPELINGVDHSPNHPDAISMKAIRDFQKTKIKL